MEDQGFLSDTRPRVRLHCNIRARTLSGKMRRFLNWLIMLFKPKKCPNCGKNDLCITETVKYIAHIDPKTKRIITDSVMESNIDRAFCINCGTVQDRAEFETSVLTD